MPSKSTDFESLVAALIDRFDKPLTGLPPKLRERVEREFPPSHWDSLTPDQRRSRAESWDYQRDPNTEQEREDLWDLYVRRIDIEQKIAEWRAIATPTASDLAQQEDRLTKLWQELADINKELSEYAERGARSPDPCRPASASQIRLYFRVIEDADENAKWWKKKMADARRYGLLNCRVGEGSKGRRGGYLWQPHMIAGWLVDRHTKGREGLPANTVRAALKRCPGCEDVADELFPPAESSPTSCGGGLP